MKRKKSPQYYFYLLRCRDKTLYSGITTDLVARQHKHNLGIGSKYVRAHGGGRIIYSEWQKNKSLALKREAAVKKWPRCRKLNLVRGQKSS